MQNLKNDIFYLCLVQELFLIRGFTDTPIYIYIYIYTSAYPCIPCTEYVRLCVERNRPSWSCPVKRFRSSGAERARAPMSSAPAEPSGLELGNVGRCNVFEQPGRAISSALAKPSEFERVRAAISSAPAEPSGLERPYRAPQRSRACSNSETSAGAVFSTSQAEQFRAPWRSRANSSGHFERPSGAERARAAISRAPAEPSGLDVANVGRCGVFEPGRANSSGHFERPSGAERARCRKRRQVQCLRARPSQAEAS